MDFAETAEHRDLRAAVASIARGFGPEYYTSHAAAGTPCGELWAKLGEAGFIGVNVPEAYGGGGGGLTELALVCEELGAQGTPLLLLLVSAAISAGVIAEFGTGEQRKVAARAGRWHGQDGVRDHRAGRRLEHPPAGHQSEPGRGRVALGGTKYYISGVDEAEALLVVARTGTDQRGDAELSLFIVPTDAPGLARQRAAGAT